MIRSVLLALPVIVLGQAASATTIAHPSHLELTAEQRDDFTVVEPLRAPPPSIIPMWEDVLGWEEPPINGGTVQLDIPLSCWRVANPGEVLGPCFPEEPAGGGGVAGQVPAPGGLLLIAAALGFVWRRQRTMRQP